MPCLATEIFTQFTFSNGVEVIRTEYEFDHLFVYVYDADSDLDFLVKFTDVQAFRVMDECHLLEYWPACSKGWLYEIQDGGWLSQEIQRSGSLIGDMTPGLREFIVTGCDDCVSVLGYEPPQVTTSRYMR